MRAVYERGDTGRHSEARERALEHECASALGIPHVLPRATLAQAFRRNVPGIASLRPFAPPPFPRSYGQDFPPSRWDAWGLCERILDSGRVPDTFPKR